MLIGTAQVTDAADDQGTTEDLLKKEMCSQENGDCRDKPLQREIETAFEAKYLVGPFSPCASRTEECRGRGSQFVR